MTATATTARTCPAGVTTADRPVVMHLVPSLQTGGAETMLLNVQDRVRTRGNYAPFICTLTGGGTLQSAFTARGLPVHSLGIQRRSLYRFPGFVVDVTRIVLALRDLVRTHHVRVLQSHLPDADLLALLAGRIAGIPTVITHQSSHLTPVRRRPGLRLGLRQVLVRTLYRRAEAVVAVSPAVQNTLTRQAHVPEKNIALIFNAVEVPTIPTAAVRAAARAALGTRDNEYTIVCTARLVPNKGQTYLIDALRALPAHDGAVHLVCIGDGEDRAALETQARSVPAPHRVSFLGLRTDAVALLPGADLFCLPSLWEGLSLAALEAMAQEVPLLAADVPGMRDTVEGERHALLVPPQDPAALAAGIRQLRGNPAFAAQLAGAGRALVAERYSLDAAARRTEALYARLLNGGTDDA